jgi:hypothetical protein
MLIVSHLHYTSNRIYKCGFTTRNHDDYFIIVLVYSSTDLLLISTVLSFVLTKNMLLLTIRIDVYVKFLGIVSKCHTASLYVVGALETIFQT